MNFSLFLIVCNVCTVYALHIIALASFVIAFGIDFGKFKYGMRVECVILPMWLISCVLFTIDLA